MTGTNTAATALPHRLNLSQLAGSPSVLALNTVSRYAPRPVVSEPVPARPAPADMATAETAFRHAVIKYTSLHTELTVALKEGKLSPEELAPMVANIREAEKASYEALTDLVKLHPHGKTIMRYCAHGSGFAAHVAALVNMDVDPLSPGYRRRTKDTFDEWKVAERNYAQLGFKTISLEDFFFSLPVEGTLHTAIYAQLLMALPEGETRVLHALDYQRKTPKLQITGGQGSMSRNNKKR